jgi:hypothetical protein
MIKYENTLELTPQEAIKLAADLMERVYLLGKTSAKIAQASVTEACTAQTESGKYYPSKFTFVIIQDKSDKNT